METTTADRSDWPVRRLLLADEHGGINCNSPEACVAMVWPLSVEAWIVAGREIPSYARSEIPARLVRPVA